MKDLAPVMRPVRRLPLGGDVLVARFHPQIHTPDRWTGRCAVGHNVHPRRDRLEAQRVIRQVVGELDPSPAQCGSGQVGWLLIAGFSGVFSLSLVVMIFSGWLFR